MVTLHAAFNAPSSGPETPQRALPSDDAIGQTEIRVKGKTLFAPSVEIDGTTVIVTGKRLRVAAVHDEDLVEGETVPDPAVLLSRLKRTQVRADIFTFAQKLPHTAPKYPYHLAWDNLAVVPITTFSEWWEHRVEPSVRRAVRKAAKSGVVVEATELNDALVRGIVSINNETPVRQGKPFWHFGKSFEAVKHENSTYPGRNIFLSAYRQGELIGYMRMILTDGVASVSQLLTRIQHFDKRPTNALIAKAVGVCEEKGLAYFVYCNYIYNDPKSSLTEFKRRNGFEKVLIPRYYVPLTFKGRIALGIGLHRGLVKRMPAPLIAQIFRARGFWYARKLKANEATI